MASGKWSQHGHKSEDNWNSPSSERSTASTPIPRDRRTGKYHLLMSNVPKDWKWHVVLKYIKNHTDHIDRAIARDITLIEMAEVPNFQRSTVHFQTMNLRNLAFTVLKKSKELFFGKRLFVSLVKYNVSPKKNKDMNDPARRTCQDHEAKPPKKKVYISTDFHITILNIPQVWTRQDISNYVRKYTDSVDEAIAEDIVYVKLKTIANVHQTFIDFRTMRYRNEAYDLLVHANDVFDGKKVEVFKEDKNVCSKVNILHDTPDVFHFVTDFDTKSFGLNKRVLEDLGIETPLTNKVLVQFLPFDFEESQIYGIFNMAGSVESVTLLNKVTHCDAIVEYENQIEAVQAVSMFNKQELFGKEISCEITSLQTMVEGMILGPGLGPNGTPLKGINSYIEMEKIKIELIKEKDKVMALNRELDAGISSLIKANKTNKVVSTPLQTDVTQNVPNPIEVLSNLLISQSSQSQNQAKPTENSEMLHSNLDAQSPAMTNQIGSIAPNLTVENNMQNVSQNVQSPQVTRLSSYNQNETNQTGSPMQVGSHVPAMQNTFDEGSDYSGLAPSRQDITINNYAQNVRPRSNQLKARFKQFTSNVTRKNSAVIQFKNLPRSVSYPVLHSKMLAVGPFKFIQMGPGNALVHFISHIDADKCFKLFNKTKIDGRIMKLKKI